MGPLKLHLALEQWTFARPFRIAGATFETIEFLLVTLEYRECTGRGEGAGVFYLQDSPRDMIRQLESVRGTIERGLDRATLQRILPAGGARNALDCALWELEAAILGRPAWQIAGVTKPRPLRTTFTCGASDPDEMAAIARGYSGARAIKVKLTGDAVDASRVRAVRDAAPDVWLAVDANQGFTLSFLESLMPVLVAADVKLIEQPFPVGTEPLLEALQSPIPIAADESVQACTDIAGLVGRFDVINIKLDKCGGLTEAMQMVKTAREAGLGVMVGNMLGTSLAMAPAFIVGQFCEVVDLDGPVLLGKDRADTVEYENGFIDCPDGLWGSPGP